METEGADERFVTNYDRDGRYDGKSQCSDSTELKPLGFAHSHVAESWKVRIGSDLLEES